MDTPKLSDDVSAKYNLVTIQPGTYDFPGFGIIDLTKLTVAAADKLVERKFPYLQLIPAAPAAPAAAPVVAPVVDNSAAPAPDTTAKAKAVPASSATPGT